MADAEVINEWIQKAEDDFKFALINLKEQKPFYAQICFHFHQAAEKILKAYMIATGLEFKKIHDLVLLLNICAAKDPSLNVISEECEYLNTFYIEARYPVHWPTKFAHEEAQKAYESAEKIFSIIKEKIKVA